MSTKAEAQKAEQQRADEAMALKMKAPRLQKKKTVEPTAAAAAAASAASALPPPALAPLFTSDFVQTYRLAGTSRCVARIPSFDVPAFGSEPLEPRVLSRYFTAEEGPEPAASVWQLSTV